MPLVSPSLLQGPTARHSMRASTATLHHQGCALFPVPPHGMPMLVRSMEHCPTVPEAVDDALWQLSYVKSRRIAVVCVLHHIIEVPQK